MVPAVHPVVAGRVRWIAAGGERADARVRQDSGAMRESPVTEADDTPARAAPSRPEPRARLAVVVAVCCARPTLRRTARIAAVVGLALTGINEGDSLVHGNISAVTGIKVAFNFLVPFIVSNLGVLAGAQRG